MMYAVVSSPIGGVLCVLLFLRLIDIYLSTQEFGA